MNSRHNTKKQRHAITAGGNAVLCGRKYSDAYFDTTLVTCPECLQRLADIRRKATVDAFAVVTCVPTCGRVSGHNKETSHG